MTQEQKSLWRRETDSRVGTSDTDFQILVIKSVSLWASRRQWIKPDRIQTHGSKYSFRLLMAWAVRGYVEAQLWNSEDKQLAVQTFQVHNLRDGTLRIMSHSWISRLPQSVLPIYPLRQRMLEKVAVPPNKGAKQKKCEKARRHWSAYSSRKDGSTGSQVQTEANQKYSEVSKEFRIWLSMEWRILET